MSFIQRFFVAILPEEWARSMEAESRLWMARCPCGFELSMWERGGIRWKAAGHESQYASCPQCGKRHWHTIYKKQVTGNPAGGNA